jgi:hypothetical protein
VDVAAFVHDGGSPAGLIKADSQPAGLRARGNIANGSPASSASDTSVWLAGGRSGGDTGGHRHSEGVLCLDAY